MGKPTFAWHFVAKTLRDGRPVPADGVKLVHSGDVIPCKSGLHASRDPYDALQYAPGGTLCLVRFDGPVIGHGGDKIVGSDRTIIHRIDAEEILRKFARKCALDVIHLWDAPQVVVDYLTTGVDSLRAAARDAARYAAWDAARDAARDEARDEAQAAATAWGRWCAARDAAWDAARNGCVGAARDAAWDAARAAARDVALKKQRLQFNELVNSEFQSFLENLD